MFTFDDGKFQDSENERVGLGGGLRQTCVYIFCSCINWKLHVNLRLVVLAFWFSYTSDRRQAAFVRSSTIRVIGEWNITNFVSFRFKWIFFNFIFFSCSCWYWLLLLVMAEMVFATCDRNWSDKNANIKKTKKKIVCVREVLQAKQISFRLLCTLF